MAQATLGTKDAISSFTSLRIVLMLMVFAAIGHFNRVGISVAGDEIFIPKMGISATKMGWVYTTFLIVYTIGMLPGGWLIDRIGSGRALALYGLTMGTFVALTGLSGWIATSPLNLWILLLIIRSFAGLCNSPLHPGAAHAVSDVMSGRRRATANGMVTAGALIGIALCYPVFGWLMDQISWPWAFAVSGSILILYGTLWSFWAVPSLPGPHPATEVEKQKDNRAVWSLLSNTSLWLITLSYAAFGYFQYLFFYWMGYYFKDVLQVPDIDARWAQFWIMLAQGAGMAIGGMSTDAACELFGRRWGRRLIVLTGMGLSAVFGLAAVDHDNLTQIAWYLALSMGALGLCEGVFWTTATDIGGKSRGFSGAFMNTGGNIGGLISPVLTPYIAQKLDWPGAIMTACIISGLGGALWFAITPPEADK